MKPAKEIIIEKANQKGSSAKTVEGHDAVEYARNNNLLLKKWADPTEPYRDELPLREAEAVCLEDPGLIFIEIDLAEEKK